MPVLLSEPSLPVFERMLGNLANMLDRAEAYAGERKFNPDVLVGARLAPDMHPLSFQVQSATDRPKFFVSRVTGQPGPSWPDTETTFTELKARVATAQTYLAGASAAEIDARAEAMVTVRSRGSETQVSAVDYLRFNVLPNFYFHVTAAYAILRHNGVPLGKADFTG